MNPIADDDRRAIARRLFEALCPQFPDKYIALIQPRDDTNMPLPAPELIPAKALAAHPRATSW
jgi:hypothetical protein